MESSSPMNGHPQGPATSPFSAHAQQPCEPQGNGDVTHNKPNEAWLQEHSAPDAAGPSSQQGPSSRAITICLIGYSLSFVVFGSQVSIIGPTNPYLAEKLGVDETDLSPLFTALGISCILSGTPSGWLVDRMPTHTVLLGSLMVQAVGFALVPFMPSVWSLTALYFVICFSYNFTNSAVFTSLGWLFPKRAGSALNLVLAMFGVGSFFIPLAAQACKHFLGSALAVFWVVALTSVVAAIPFTFMPSPTPPPPMLCTDGPNPFKASKRAQRLEWLTTASVVLLVFFTTAAETAIGNWLYTYGVEQEKLPEEQSAYANSAFWGSFTVGRVLGAAISHLITPGTLLLCCTPLAMLGASLPLWAGVYLTPSQLVMTTAVLCGLGNSTGYANAVSLLELYVPVTGFVNGMFGMVAGGACMVGPTTVAMLAKYTQLKYSAMAWVGCVFYLLHYPAIITTMVTGNRLLQLYDTGIDPDDDPEAGTAAAAGGGLTEPLLNGSSPGHDVNGTASVPIGVRQGARQSEEGTGRGNWAARPSTSFRHGSLTRQTSDGMGARLANRASIPGHASPIAGSMG